MAFGFGFTDFGFSEMNPFGIRGGQGVNLRRSSGGFAAPVGTGLSANQAQQAGRTVGMRDTSFPISQSGGQQYKYPIGPQPANNQPRSRTYTAPKPSSGGSGGGASRTDNRISGLKSTAQNQTVDPNQEYAKLLEQQFGANANYLQGLRGDYSGERDRALAGLSGEIDAQRGLLDSARDELLSLNASRKDDAKRQAQNTLAEMRLLFNELGQSTRQRYGGTSSAGEFANQLQGREFQRQQGQTLGARDENLATLAAQDEQIIRGYQAQVQALEAQKTNALQQLRAAFDERLREIDSRLAENDQAKAQAKLDLLRQVNERARGIQDYVSQLQAQADAQATAAKQNIYSAYQEYLINAGQAPDLQGMPVANFSTIGGMTQGAEVGLPQGFFRRPQEQEFIPTGLFRPEEEQLAF